MRDIATQSRYVNQRQPSGSSEVTFRCFLVKNIVASLGDKCVFGVAIDGMRTKEIKRTLLWFQATFLHSETELGQGTSRAVEYADKVKPY